MLKFVHTKPPRAKSTSPAGSTGSLERSASPRHRDRSYPPYPPLHPSQPLQGEVGPFQPRGRADRGGRLSPGPSRTPSAELPQSFEGGFRRSPTPGTFQARDRGQVTFPSDSDLSSVGRFPVTDRDRGRERPRTGSPRDRHVRIAPYPAEEIYIGSRPSPFPVPERDRSDSPSSVTPTSILTKHPRDRADAHSIRSPPGPSRSSWDKPHVDRLTPPGTIGARQSRERAWGPEGEGASTGHSWASTGEHPASGTEPSWARPQHDEGTSRAGVREQSGGEPAGRARESDRGREGEPQRDRSWKPKLFFSGSWLHGPSRHRIFATKSAQPQPQPPVCISLSHLSVISYPLTPSYH